MTGERRCAERSEMRRKEEVKGRHKAQHVYNYTQVKIHLTILIACINYTTNNIQRNTERESERINLDKR